MSEQVVGLWTQLWLDNSDVTATVSPYLLSLEYSDNLDGDSPDTLKVSIEDSTGQFQSKHYPKKGAALRFEFGFDKPGHEFLFKSANGFEIDSIAISGPPDSVTWTASCQKPSGAIHIRKSRAWKDTTLQGIASAIAGEHNIELKYNVSADISFDHIAQMNESDLEFLKRLARKYGILLSLKSGKTRLTIVMSDPDKPLTTTVYEITRENVISFKFNDSAIKGAKGSQTAYFDSANKKLVTASAAGSGEGEHEIRTVGVSQAPAAHAQGNVNDAAKDKNTNQLTLPGNPRLVSGVTVSLSGWGFNDGDWIVKTSEHTLTVTDGYKTVIYLRRPQ